MDKIFRVSNSAKSIITSALFGFWISFPLTIFIFGKSVFDVLNTQAERGNNLFVLLVSILGVYVAFTGPLSIVNQFNEIRVNDDGLYIRVYKFRYIWEFVKWKDVYEIRLSSKPDRWGLSQWLVKVNNLTYWHRVISQQFQSGTGSVLVLNSELMDREDLIEIIERKLKKPG
jgi:hypothetical protein